MLCSPRCHLGRAHTRAAPGDAPGYHMYLCVCRAFDRQVPMRVMGFDGDGHLLQTLSPWIGKLVIHAHSAIIRRSYLQDNMYHVRCLSPHPHLGTVQPHLGTRPARVQPDKIRYHKIVGLHDAARLTTLRNSAMPGSLTPRETQRYG